MSYLLKLFSEAIFVGISLIILGNLVGFLVGKYYIKPELPSGCSEYNKYYVMELTLFLTGFFFVVFQLFFFQDSIQSVIPFLT